MVLAALVASLTGAFTVFGGESPAGTGTCRPLYVETDAPPAVIDYRFVHYSSCGIWVDALTVTQGHIAFQKVYGVAQNR